MDLLRPWQEPIFDSMQGYAMASRAGETELGPTKIRLMNLRRNALQKAYVDRWNASATNEKQRIDGIIQAVSPWAAPRLGGTQAKSLYVGFTGVWNFLGTSSSYLHACNKKSCEEKVKLEDALADIFCRFPGMYFPRHGRRQEPRSAEGYESVQAAQ
jgi:hypothetical protein